MSQAEYLQDMLKDPDLDAASGVSEVARFYAGCNVLITGASGFLGKLLIEKILRTCSKVNTLFLLLRAKKGKTPDERFEELFNDVIFDRMKKERPEYAKKVVLIAGDMVEADLGLSPEDRELLRSTNIVIHGAATVRFDEKLRIAVSINVRGTKELLLLAREMPGIKAFVHISTAFSNCVYKRIEEKYYPPAIDSEKLLSLIDILDDACLDHLTPAVLGKWPNTYAFTKAVAEDSIRQHSQGLPVCVVRPSIVIATSKEPVSGWINNVYGATGILVGAAVGILRTLHADPDLVADMIPADYVVNTVVAAAWDAAKSRTENVDADRSTDPKVEEPPIYNVVSSCQSPITWGQLSQYTAEYGMEVPSMVCMWYFCYRCNKHLWLHKLSVIFLHLLPAIIVDSLARLTGRKPILWDAYKKIHKFSSVISGFAMQQWEFTNDNVQRLWKRMNPTDRSEFDVDVGGLDWRDFSYGHVRGLRVYLLKDPLDTVPQGLVKYFRLKVAHYTLVTVVCGFLLWLLWTFLRFIVSW